MKKKILFSLLLFTLLLAYFLFEPVITYPLGWNSFSENESIAPVDETKNDRYAEAINEASAVFDSAKQQLEAPAFSVAVGIDNEVIWNKTAGFRDVAQSVAANNATSFRIGSTSKAITSALLGKLLEQNKLQLNATIQSYVPFVKMEKAISIRQLASHTSGIRNYGLCFCLPALEYYNNDH